MFTTFVGWDTMLLAALAEGAAGCILGAPNLAARALVQLYDAVQAGELGRGTRGEWTRLYPVMRFPALRRLRGRAQGRPRRGGRAGRRAAAPADRAHAGTRGRDRRDLRDTEGFRRRSAGMTRPHIRAGKFSVIAPAAGGLR